MPDGQEALQRGILQAGQAIGQGLATGLQARRMAQIQQQQALATRRKQQFTQAQGRIELGLKLLKTAKTDAAQMQILNQMIGPSIPIVFPGMQGFNVDLMDDPSRDASRMIVNAYTEGGLQAVRDILPVAYQTAAQAQAPQEAIKTVRGVAEQYLPGQPRQIDVGLQRMEVQPDPITGEYRPMQVRMPGRPKPVPAVAPKADPRVQQFQRTSEQHTRAASRIYHELFDPYTGDPLIPTELPTGEPKTFPLTMFGKQWDIKIPFTKKKEPNPKYVQGLINMRKRLDLARAADEQVAKFQNLPLRLSPTTAQIFLDLAQGDPEKAKEMARQAGYTD